MWLLRTWETCNTLLHLTATDAQLISHYRSVQRHCRGSAVTKMSHCANYHLPLYMTHVESKYFLWKWLITRLTYHENTATCLSATFCMSEIITSSQEVRSSHSSSLGVVLQISICKAMQILCRGLLDLLPIYLFHWAINKSSHKALSHRVRNKTNTAEKFLSP